MHTGSWDTSSGTYGSLGGLQIYSLTEHRWISGAIDGDSPVGERDVDPLGVFPSSAGHVKPRVNLGGPSPKAKYYSVTDSEQVP